LLHLHHTASRDAAQSPHTHAGTFPLRLRVLLSVANTLRRIARRIERLADVIEQWVRTRAVALPLDGGCVFDTVTFTELRMVEGGSAARPALRISRTAAGRPVAAAFAATDTAAIGSAS